MYLAPLSHYDGRTDMGQRLFIALLGAMMEYPTDAQLLAHGLALVQSTTWKLHT